MLKSFLYSLLIESSFLSGSGARKWGPRRKPDKGKLIGFKLGKRVS